MSGFSRRLIGWAGGAATLAVVCSATTATATETNPNHCLAGSTGTNCLIQLDMINDPANSYTYHDPGYVTGSIQTIADDSHSLLVTFDANTINGQLWAFGELFLNIVDPSHATASHISFTDATPGGQAPTYSLSTVSTLSSPVSASNPGPGGVFQADGWGDFDFVLGTHPGMPYAADHLSFEVTWDNHTWTDGSGLSQTGRLLSDAVLLVNGSGTAKGQNDGGQSAGAHVFNLTTGFTGYAAWPGPLDVPEPASLALLATGLAGLGLVRRRFSRGSA